MKWGLIIANESVAKKAENNARNYVRSILLNLFECNK